MVDRTTAGNSESNPTIGFVTEVTGNVRLLPQNHELVAGGSLPLGHTIVTGENGMAVVRFASGGAVVLGYQQSLRLDDDLLVRLQGDIEYLSQPDDSQSMVEQIVQGQVLESLDAAVALQTGDTANTGGSLVGLAIRLEFSAQQVIASAGIDTTTRFDSEMSYAKADLNTFAFNLSGVDIGSPAGPAPAQDASAGAPLQSAIQNTEYITIREGTGPVSLEEADDGIEIELTIPDGVNVGESLVVTITPPGKFPMFVYVDHFVSLDEIGQGVKFTISREFLKSGGIDAGEYLQGEFLVEVRSGIIGRTELLRHGATAKFVLDTIDPEVPDYRLRDNDDSAALIAIDDGDVTNDTTPLVSGIGAEPNASIEIFDGNGVSLGTTNVNDDGSWDFEPSSPLPQGPNKISVQQTDEAGNKGPMSAATNFIIDSSAPMIIDRPTVNALETRDTTPEITGTVVLKGTDSFSVTVNGVSYTTANGLVVDVANKTWSLKIPSSSPLPDEATYDVVARVSDINGSVIDGSNNELTILPPIVVAITTDNSEAEEGVEDLVFVVSLSNASLSTSTFTLAFSPTSTAQSNDYSLLSFTNGVSYNSATGEITVPANVTSFRVVVDTVHDLNEEQDESVVLLVGGKSATGTIINNDISNADPDAVDDTNEGLNPGLLLISENFNNNANGWVNGSSNGSKLVLNKDNNVNKTFDFGDEHAGETVLISFTVNAKDNWDKSGDVFRANFNDVAITKNYRNSNKHTFNNIAVVVDAEGKVKVSFKADTNATNEKGFIDDFKIVSSANWSGDLLSTSEDNALLINVLANDVDADGDSLTISHINNEAASGGPIDLVERGLVVGTLQVVGGKVIFEPGAELDQLAEGQERELTFTYRVNDGRDGTDTATVTFTVVGVNDAIGPVTDTDVDVNSVVANVTNGAYAGITASAEDIDNQSVSYRLQSNPGGLFAVDSVTGQVTVANAAGLGPEGTEHDIVVLAESDDKTTSTETFTVTITEAVQVSSIDVSNAGNSVVEGGTLEYSVNLSKASANATGMSLSLSGSATENIDYSALVFSDNVTYNAATDTISIPAGVDGFTITVASTEDTVFEGDETVIVSIDGETATGTIIDNDTRPTVSSINNTNAGNSVIEGGNLEYSVSLSNTSASVTTMSLSLSGTATENIDYSALIFSDNVTYNAATDTISIPAGVDGFTITVASTEDTVFEDDETVIVNIDGENATGTIIDDDSRPTVTSVINTNTDNEVAEGSALTFKVTLSGVAGTSFDLPSSFSGDVIAADLGLVTVIGGSYDSVTGKITVDAGVTELMISVATVDDREVEADEAVTFMIDGKSATATIIDDDNTDPDAVDDLNIVLRPGLTLVNDRFNDNINGWINGASNGSKLVLNKDRNVHKTFDFGVEHAGETVLVSFVVNGQNSWEVNGDIFRANFNDVTITKNYSNDRTHAFNNVAVVVDAQGKVKVSFKADTSAANEKGFIDNFKIVSGSNWTELALKTSEDNALTIDVLANDSDADGHSISITHLNGIDIRGGGPVDLIDAGVVIGTLAVVLGKVVFTPNDNLDSMSVGDSKSLSFTYSITDGNGGSDTALAQFKIVGSNDEISVVVDNDGQANTVAEDAAIGSVVGVTALALDVDAGDTVSYKLSAADVSAGLFKINSVTGVVTVKGALNFEATDSHSITVIASSTDGSSKSENFTITVTNVNEDVSPVVDKDTSTNEITSNAEVGTEVGITALATDPDDGDVVRYRLNDVSGAFEIDAITGKVTVKDPAKLGAGGSSHEIEVTAFSTDQSISRQTFSILVKEPIVLDRAVVGVEDTNYVFTLSDLTNSQNVRQIKITVLPEDGALEYRQADGSWVAFAKDTVISADDIGNGKLRFVPAENESGDDSFTQTGAGNLKQDYAKFEFQMTDGPEITVSSPTAVMTVDITPVADGATFTTVIKIDGSTDPLASEATFDNGGADEPSMARTADDGYIITWSVINQNNYPNGVTAEVHARQYQKDGTPLGDLIIVNSTELSDDTFNHHAGYAGADPKVIVLTNGDFVVAWANGSDDGKLGNIYLQRFNSLGEKIGGEVLVNQDNAEHSRNYSPNIIELASGNIVVTWESRGRNYSQYSDDGDFSQVNDIGEYFNNHERSVGAATFMQVYSSDGSVIEDNRLVDYADTSVVVVDSPYNNNTSQPLQLANGDFLVTYSRVWNGQPEPGGGFSDTTHDVFVQRYDASYQPVGDPFSIDSTVNGRMIHDANLTLLSDGTLLAVWDDGLSGLGLSRQRFVINDDSIIAIGGKEIIYDQGGIVNNDAEVVVLTGPEGGYVMVWNTFGGKDGDFGAVSMRFYNDDGTARSDEKVFNNITENHQSSPDVVALSNGEIVITWTGSLDSASSNTHQIFHQRFNSNGNRLGTYDVNNPTDLGGTGDEDTVIPFLIPTTQLIDTDGSEILTVLLKGIPKGAVISDGTGNKSDGIQTEVDISGWDRSSLRILPAPDFNGQITLSVSAFTTERNDQRSATNSLPVTITVLPVVDDVSVAGFEDTAYVFSKTDFGSNSFTELKIQTLPADGELQLEQADGSWLVIDTTGVVISAEMIAKGQLRFVPDKNESGDDSFTAVGVGNLKQDYAIFEFQMSEGPAITASTPTATMTIDIAGVADGLNVVVGIVPGEGSEASYAEGNQQYNPIVESLSDGGYVIVWNAMVSHSSAFLDFTTAIHYQRYDSSGEKVGSVNTVEIGSSHRTTLLTPDVTATEDGGFTIAYLRVIYNSSSGQSTYSRVMNRVDDDDNITHVSTAINTPTNLDYVTRVAGDHFQDSAFQLLNLGEGNGFVLINTFYNPYSQPALTFYDDDYTIVRDKQPIESGVKVVNSQTYQIELLNEQGDFAVVWTASNSAENNIGSVFTRNFSKNGTALTEITELAPLNPILPTYNFLSNSTPDVSVWLDGNGNQLGTAVATTDVATINSTGEAVADFNKFGLRLIDSNQNVENLVIEISGAMPVHTLINIGINWSQHVNLITLANGSFVLSSVADFNGDVKAFSQLIDSSGNTVGEPIIHNPDNAEYDDFYADHVEATVLDDGSVAVTWTARDIAQNGYEMTVMHSRFDVSQINGVTNGDEDSNISIKLPDIDFIDRDGSEILTVLIKDIPLGAIISDANGNRSDGTQTEVDVAGWDSKSLVILPPTDFSGKITLSVESYTTEQGSGNQSNVSSFNTTVIVSAQSSIKSLAYDSDTPLILDLDGDGVETLSVDNGVVFDIDGDGDQDQTGWVGKDDGLLVRDINGDGRINDAKELFGNASQTTSGAVAADGFAALAELDTNGDGRFDSADTSFNEVKVWRDSNSDGISQADELQSLDDIGLQSIDLSAQAINESNQGNTAGLRSSWTDKDGAEHDVDDVWFAHRDAVETSAVNLAVPDNNESSILGYVEEGIPTVAADYKEGDYFHLYGEVNHIKGFDVREDSVNIADLLDVTDESINDVLRHLSLSEDDDGNAVLNINQDREDSAQQVIFDELGVQDFHAGLDCMGCNSNELLNKMLEAEMLTY